jgi:hypothetical protein
MMAGAARNAVRRTRNGEGSDAVGVAVASDADVSLGRAGTSGLEGGPATPRDDEDSRIYEEQTAPRPSRRMMASVCRSSVGPEGRLSLPARSGSMLDTLVLDTLTS